MIERTDSAAARVSRVSPGWLPALGLFGAAAFLIGLWQDLYWLRLIVKPIPMACMIVWVSQASRERYARLVLAGLSFSLLGDVLLELDASLFLPGLLAFLLAQVFYIVTFMDVTRELKLLRALPFVAWGAIAYGVLLPNLGAMTAPVGAYVVVICAMMWRASACVGEGGRARPDQWAALAGAVLFALSDTLLALNRFNAPIEGARFVIIVLYWLGQLGITLSVKRPIR